MESTCNKYIMLINYFCHSVMRPFHALEISRMIRSWGGYQCYCTRYLLGVLYEGKFISNDISRYIHGGLTCMLEGSDHWPPSSRPQRRTSTLPWTPWAGEDNIDNSSRRSVWPLITEDLELRVNVVLLHLWLTTGQQLTFRWAAQVL